MAKTRWCRLRGHSQAQAAYYDLVIQVAIIRPGPISGGMVHPFLRRRNGEETVVYPHPSLQPVLEKTLGVPLFQEQVMKLAVLAADYTPGEADQLRRDMAAWRIKGRIEQHHDRFVPRMIAKGIAPEFAERVFEQIRGFGEYGFPESHAASFALIAYATAWVRCHYPEAFVCSLLNAQPMGFYAPATIISDGQRHGVTVLPVSVQGGNWQCRLEPTAITDGTAPRYCYAVRMGLRYVKGLAEREGERIETARREGPFRTLADFVARAGLDAAKTGRLAEAGALACFQASRRQALWEARGTHRAQDPEFGVEPEEADMQFAPLSLLEEVAWDYDASSHSTRGHPLAPLRLSLAAQGLPTAREVQAMRDGSRIRYAGLVICRQQPATAHGAVFMTLEDETGFVNLVLWKDVFAKHRVVARTAGFLGITGKLQSESGTVNLVAEELWVPLLEALPPEAGSRDFH